MFNFKNSNLGKIRIKLLATLLVLTLTFANFALVGSYIGEAIAAEIDLNKQDNSTNNENVKFELYFDEENKTQIQKDINANNLVLHAKVSVENSGVLENAKLELTDTSFELRENVSLDIGTLKAGEYKNLSLPIQMKKDGSIFNLKLLDMMSKITLTGDYKNGTEIENINTPKYVQVDWTSEEIDLIPDEEPLPIELTQELITNKIYSIQGTDKRVVQYKITSGITNNQYPIKSTMIELQVPKYDETTKQILTAEEIVEGVKWVAPEEVVVSAYLLNATNPNERLNFKEYDEENPNNAYYSYNQAEGKVNINITNKENDKNEITWNKEGKDEFVVTYIYPADVEVAQIESIINSEIALHDLDNRPLRKKITNTQSNVQELSNIVSLETYTKDIYKGNMYIGEDTNYETISKIYVSYSQIADGILYAENANEEPNQIPSSIATYYTTTKINKADAIKVLGTEGKIKVLGTTDSININNPGTEQLIDLSQEIEGDYYTISYGENISQISIGMIPVQSEGTIEIINEKVIKVSDQTDKETILKLTGIKANTGIQIVNINEDTTITGASEVELIETVSSESISKLVAPDSEAEFSVTGPNETTKFSTSNENDVYFTIELKTDDIKYNLYNAPEIVITLPDVVEKIEDVNAVIMNKNALEIESAVPENNTIKIKLSGKQESYTSANEQISVNAKIEAKKLIPTVNEDITMTLTNGEETIEKSQTVTFEAEQGVLLATSVSNYNSENITITSFGEEIVTGNLEEGKAARTATVKGTIINNTKSDLENIAIFGKIQNEKSEIIELEKIEKGSVIEFEYDIVIPENLKTNKEIIVNYEVYSNNQTYIAPEVKLQTPKEIKLDLELTANVQNEQEIYEGQKLEYNIKVTNIGEVDAENLTLNIVAVGLNITEGQTVIEGLNIKAGETVEKQIKAIASKDATNISVTAEATTDYLLQEAKDAITNTVSKPGIELEINKTVSTYSEYVDIAQIGSTINYQLEITNTLNDYLNNIQIIDNLPEELEFKELNAYKIFGEDITKLDLEKIEYSYNEQTKELKLKIDNLKAGEKALISIYTNVEKVVDSNIVNTTYVTANDNYPDITFSITDNTKVIGLPKITSSVTTSVQGKLNVGDEIEYTIKVKNDGETKEFITIESIIPKELNIQSAYYYYTEGEQKEAAVNFNKVTLYSMNLKQNEELTVKITAKVNEIESNTNIENQVTITGLYIEQITEKIENTIIGTGKQPGDNPSDKPGENPGENPSDNPSDNPGQNPDENPDDELDQNPDENPSEETENQEEKTYSISGIAWQDDNKNGARESEEKILSGIIVKIINANTNEYLLDEQGNTIKETTNENGIYEFTNLKPGKYILIYEYNKTTYSTSQYQKSGVDSTLNSDARLVTEENNNITKTDILEITNKNISNIDIGLILNPIFDLRLDKYITKVTVKNSNGTKVYEYDKTQLAKVEIPAKVLEGSIIIVEYQIDVSNEGDIPAHVDTIVDYVSPQFEFKSELNTTWYKASDNNLYCIEFANKDLKPGETLSTKLILTKTMTNNNTGLVNNAAEIYETFNEYAFEDLDSTPANKGEEDDLSEADIIISIKTGGPLLYIGVVIIVMTILSAGIYLINKKVIKNHII